MGLYKNIRQIGEGTFGKVYKAMMTGSEGIFAIKKVRIDPDAGIPYPTVREIRALKKLRSKYVIGLEEVLAEEYYISLVLEYLPFNLSALISQRFSFTDDHIYSITFQLLKAVDFVHSIGMIHRDLKPGHILLDLHGRLKLTGFGLTRYPSDRMTNYVCSLWYRAPELLLGDISYTSKVDSWSIACIILEMGNGSPVFKSTDDISQCKAVLSVLGSPGTEYPWSSLFRVDKYAKKESWNQVIQDKFGSILDHKLLQVVKELLILDKDKRLSVHNALKLPAIRRGEKIFCSYQYGEIDK